ncbi:MAG: hypothetical protein GY835_23855 [bacterium]|nr:hypothetical protein [bacterium]
MTSLALALLTALLATPARPQIRIGKATVYHPGDGHSGSHKADGSAFLATDSHIAARGLLGRTGVLCNLRTQRCVQTSVRDQGPFGAWRKCRDVSGQPADWTSRGKTFKPRKIRWWGVCYWWQSQPGGPRDGWSFRGAFDLTQKVARAIGHRGFDAVAFVY